MINSNTTYTPYLCYLSAVSTGATTAITTTQTHAFVVGNQVQFVIPKQWGISQLNGRSGIVTGVTSNTLTVNIDSRGYDAFNSASVALPQVIDTPQVIPIGDTNIGYTTPGGQAPALVIPGSYQAPPN